MEDGDWGGNFKYFFSERQENRTTETKMEKHHLDDISEEYFLRFIKFRKGLHGLKSATPVSHFGD